MLEPPADMFTHKSQAYCNLPCFMFFGFVKCESTCRFEMCSGAEMLDVVLAENDLKTCSVMLIPPQEAYNTN